ncbi:uncharacterized protein LOC132741942 [Ruditapes philippinarum]|uniref:uncharacterized protein LOC132741942 n=1 Tax=Ruditapes philippinarum TaxID=129788 RepID=UPI00295BDAD5|nr:uncharacterized protein LOC132741942 [Ruditapes philippinarum]
MAAENSAHLAQYTTGPAPQVVRSQTNAASASRPTNIHSPQVSRAQQGLPQSDRQVGSPPLPRPQQNSAHSAARQSDNHTFPARVQDNAVNHLSRLQDTTPSKSSSGRQVNDTQSMESSQGEDFSFNEDLMEGEHMATLGKC